MIRIDAHSVYFLQTWRFDGKFKEFYCYWQVFCDNFFDIVGPHGPHAKGAKVVGAVGALAMERRLPAAARRHMVTSMTGICKLRYGPYVR